MQGEGERGMDLVSSMEEGEGGLERASGAGGRIMNPIFFRSLDSKACIMADGRRGRCLSASCVG